MENGLMKLTSLLTLSVILFLQGDDVRQSPRPELAQKPFAMILERQYDNHPFSVTPLIIGDRMILADYKGHVTSVRLDSGNVDWEFQGDSLGYEAPVAHDGDRLYAAAAEGIIDCLDLKTGDSRWAVNCDGIVSAPMLVHENILLIGTQSAQLICLDKLTGKEQWRFKAADEIRSVPRVVGNNILVVAACSRTLHVVDRTTGDGIRQIELPAECVAPITVQGDQVYLTTMYGDAMCYDWQNAKEIWSYSFNPELMPQMPGGPLIVDDIMFVGGTDSFLRAFNIKTRKEIWKRRIKGSVETPLVISNDVVCGVTVRGRVYALDRESGVIRWQYESSGSIIASPVVVDDTLIFANNEGKLYRFGPLSR